ncbi:MAG: FecR domain-containing protein [Oligoflexia bacterium]|nr:FecR domain-containing protein [Oligoflexia bacterium]
MTENTIIAANPPTATRSTWPWASLGLLAALAVELYLLLNDVPLLPGQGAPVRGPTTAPVAELMTQRNIVRVQAPGGLVWEETTPGQVLHRSESVLTLARSRAEIAFLDGTGLVLDENTLVQLEKTPSDDASHYQKIVVKLLRGKLHKSAPKKASQLLSRQTEKGTTPPLEIQVGDTRAILNSATELTVTALPERMSVEVHSGEVELSAPQKQITVTEGEEATLDAKGSSPRVARKIPLTLLAPRAGTHLLPLATRTSVDFRWRNNLTSLPAVPMDLEAGTDPAFEGEVIRLRIPATEPPLKSVQASLKLPTGAATATRWYWRVRPLDRNASPSATESFWIQPLPVPRLKSSGPDLFWSAVEGATGYLVEISRAGEQTRVVPVTTTTLRVPTSGAGDYRLRVRAQLPSQLQTPWSAPHSFTVQEAADSAALPPPPGELLDAEINEEKLPPPQQSWLQRLLLPSAWAAEPESSRWSVKLKWKRVSGVRKYKVQIGRERSFKTIIAEATTDAPEYVWSYLPGQENSKGRIFFRVASMSNLGLAGTYSEPKPVQLRETVAAKKTPKTAPTAANNETYAAIDANAVESSPTDAAESGDLHTLAEKPSAPKVAAREAVVAPVAAMPTASVASAIPAATGASVTPTVPAPTSVPARHRFNASAALFTGIGNENQAGTDPELRSVDIRNPHAQQKLRLSTALLRVTDEGLESSWSAQAQGSFTRFAAVPTARPVNQPDIKAWSIRLDVLRQVRLAAIASGEWTLALGGTLDRPYRFVKAGPQAATVEGAISLGPAGTLAHRVRGRAGGFADLDLGIGLGLPITGLVTGGFIGINPLVWSEWRGWSFGKFGSLGIRFEFEASLQRWSRPEGTTLTTWVAWLAPTLRLGESFWQPAP